MPTLLELEVYRFVCDFYTIYDAPVRTHWIGLVLDRWSFTYRLVFSLLPRSSYNEFSASRSASVDDGLKHSY